MAKPGTPSSDWTDRAEVEQLIHRYASGVTRADWDDVEAVFAPEGVMEIAAPYNIRLEGPSAIRAFLANATADLELLVQTAHSPIVRLASPNDATAISIIHELVRGTRGTTSDFAEAGTESNYEQYAIYYDRASKIDGSWKLTHRRFRSIYQAHGGVTGSAVATRADLIADR